MLPERMPSGTSDDSFGSGICHHAFGPQSVEGFFLVNEGNMGSNKCTIDHFDARTGSYFRNIYPERNPDVVKELGDVGNDIGIYGNRLYVVVNCSNFVEVMNVHTAEHIAA